MASAQSLADGYLLTSTTDTIKAIVKIPKTLFGKLDTPALQNRLKIQDSLSNLFIKLTPKQVLGYGFKFDNQNRDFLERTLPGEKPHFYERIASGTILNCLYFVTERNRTLVQIFNLERANGQSTLIKLPMRFKLLKRKIQELFSDQKNIADQIDNFNFSKRRIKMSMIELTKKINQN